MFKYDPNDYATPMITNDYIECLNTTPMIMFDPNDYVSNDYTDQQSPFSATVITCNQPHPRILGRDGVCVRLESNGLQRGLNLRVRHEIFPNQAAAIVLNHDRDNGLVETHPHLLKRVLG